VRILIVVNARSGGSDAALYEFAREVGLQGVETVLRFIGAGQRAEDLLTDAATFDRVVAAGGDGTVSAICYALRGTGVPILVYPAGTANLVALNLGLPSGPKALAETLLTGVPVGFDLGELQYPAEDGSITRSGFTVMAGAGYDASIMESAQPIKATFGAAAYLIAAVGNINPTIAQFELVLDGEHVSTDGIAILLINFGRIQFELDVTADWSATDGLLDIAVVRTKNPAGLVPLIVGAMLVKSGDGPNRAAGGIDTYRAARVEVSAYPRLKTQYDGEATESLTPFAAEVLPAAATLIVPRDSDYAP
jgi:diacylglycerol kinase family enzyme